MRESKGEEIEGKMFPYATVESGVSPGVCAGPCSVSRVSSLEPLKAACCQLNPPDLRTPTSCCVQPHPTLTIVLHVCSGISFYG